ncbi:MAG: hypothetical protein L6Q99_17725 [Planctomycetes bacterium]|nr:hypothetical protein [Planctomycetota bacterium]
MSALESVSCARVRARLESLLEEELSAVEEARDRGHLEVCGPCARELAARRAWRREFAAGARVDDASFAWWTHGLSARLAEARAPRGSADDAAARERSAVGGREVSLARAAAPSTSRAGSSRAQPLRRAVAAATLAAAALVALALADAWSGARSGSRPIEELFAAAPRPKLALERLVLDWPDVWSLGEERAE